MMATLKEPQRGYVNIELIEEISAQVWRAEICGSGKEIIVSEDDYELA
jgi:hypothetical protein